jgi:hypothetical protein
MRCVGRCEFARPEARSARLISAVWQKACNWHGGEAWNWVSKGDGETSVRAWEGGPAG